MPGCSRRTTPAQMAQAMRQLASDAGLRKALHRAGRGAVRELLPAIIRARCRAGVSAPRKLAQKKRAA